MHTDIPPRRINAAVSGATTIWELPLLLVLGDGGVHF